MREGHYTREQVLDMDRAWVRGVINHPRDQKGNLARPRAEAADRREWLWGIGRQRGWPEHRIAAWVREETAEPVQAG